MLFGKLALQRTGFQLRLDDDVGGDEGEFQATLRPARPTESRTKSSTIIESCCELSELVRSKSVSASMVKPTMAQHNLNFPTSKLANLPSNEIPWLGSSN